MSRPIDIDRPVQLTLRLHRGGSPRRHVRRPIWSDADLADLGAPMLRARWRDVRVRLDVARLDDGDWIGHHDAVLPGGGTSGTTRRQPTRQDALTSAAHALARHCRRISSTTCDRSRHEVRAAKEVLRWLDILDLL